MATPRKTFRKGNHVIEFLKIFAVLLILGGMIWTALVFEGSEPMPSANAIVAGVIFIFVMAVVGEIINRSMR